MRISAILPCYNEAENIEPAYEEITAALQNYEAYEIIIIDDGSTDETLKKIKCLAHVDPHVKYISLSRNFGNNPAFSIGYLYASYEWSIQFDADLQSPPAEAHKLIEKTQEGWDVVFSIRKNRQDPFYRVLGTKIQQFIASRLFKIDIPLGASVYRILRTSVARDIIRFPARAQYFIATVPYVTSNYTFVETAHNPRRAGQSKWGWKQIWAHTFDLYWGFSLRPLFLIWIFAFIAIVGGVASVLFFGFDSRSALAFVLGLSTLQLIALAILGEYVRRPFTDSPYYKQVYVRQSNIERVQKDFETRELCA